MIAQNIRRTPDLNNEQNNWRSYVRLTERMQTNKQTTKMMTTWLVYCMEDPKAPIP